MVRFSDIRWAWKIDLFEACYALSNEEISVFDDLPGELLPSRNKPGSALLDMWRNFFRIASKRYSERKNLKDGKLLFFVHTPNNTKALAFLRSHYEGEFFESSDICGLGEALLSFLFLPCMLKKYRKSSSLRKKVMKLYFHEFLGFYPLFLGAVSYLRRMKPTAVFFANDHAMSPRAVFYATKYLGIPTVYIQHASITARMPRLEFDLALLDGPATLERYKEAGPVLSEVVLVGLPRMDSLESGLKTVRTDAIGLCTTLLDQPEKVELTIIQLKMDYPDRQIGFRYHPGENEERKSRWEGLCRKYDLRKSVPSEESIGAFLGSVSLMIAGDCSVHLESSLLGTPSIMMPWSGIVSDRYGYLGNHLVSLCEDPSELGKMVPQVKVSMGALSRFVAVPDPEEGRTQAFKAIDRLLEFNAGGRS